MTAPHETTTRPAMPLSSILKVAGAWALVGVPLAWGVWEVFRKSLDLFR